MNPLLTNFIKLSVISVTENGVSFAKSFINSKASNPPLLPNEFFNTAPKVSNCLVVSKTFLPTLSIPSPIAEIPPATKLPPTKLLNPIPPPLVAGAVGRTLGALPVAGAVGIGRSL